MQRDIRETAEYREVEALYRSLRQPGTGQIFDASELHCSPSGEYAVFCGTVAETLDSSPPTRICRIHLQSGDIRVLTFGPNKDRLPKYSPDGTRIAFLSDRNRAGNFQLYLLDPVSGAARSTPTADGWVEYFHWSPNGNQILLGVAGHGADLSGGQGAVTSKQTTEKLPTWMPIVDSGDESYRWRSAWVYDLAKDEVGRVNPTDSNIWEAVWCGTQAVAMVSSPGPGEGLWYDASLHVIDLDTGGEREVYAPQDQIGWPAASPSGTQLAIVEAVCSDRWIVAGDLKLINIESGAMEQIDTHGVDITYTEWRSDQHLLLAGHRGFETVICVYDANRKVLTEVWYSSEISTGGRYVAVSGLNESGDCALVGEGFLLAPEIALICGGTYRSVRSIDLADNEETARIEAVDRVIWNAPDGLEIQGWLLRPKGEGPWSVIMNIHGGPVWHWRPGWLGRSRSTPFLMLVNKGYAVFLPNPRGSAGRGQEFARKVKGDLNGQDAQDLLSGLDALVERGVADRTRIGVTGVSYGGNMTAWLITQDSRFAAAVAVAPHTNQVTEHLISNIPRFVSLFLADHYTNPGGKYFERSPIMHAHKVKTPTLNICGALDRCTPPEEALQFHNALLESGTQSVLVTYPEEGHGVQSFPASIDYATRVVSWFEQYIGNGERRSTAERPARMPSS